jgi:choice-of-anchor A domain-containing protein
MTYSNTSRASRLTLDQLPSRDTPATIHDLGEASTFNAFFFDGLTVSASDAEGRIAVGGNATLTSYGIGDRLSNSNGTRDDLIVGGNLDFTNGQVFNGNLVHGGAAHLQGVGIPNGDQRQESNVLDFEAIEADLTDTSAALGVESANGRVSVRWGSLNLRGMHGEMNVFAVTAEQLANAHSITILTPFRSAVLINVSGESVRIADLGLRIRGAECANVLWNFPEADELTVTGVGLKGSILAPTAALSFQNGQIQGTVVASSMTGNGQFNLCPSTFRFVAPDPAALHGAVFLDMDGDNQRGDPAVDMGLEGADVYLAGIDSLGRPSTGYALSQPDGLFTFTDLWPGQYIVSVVPPQRYESSALLGIPGMVNGAPTGTGAVNEVRAIVIGSGQVGVDYLLPLFPDQN